MSVRPVRIDEESYQFFKSQAEKRGVGIGEAVKQVIKEHRNLTFWEEARQVARAIQLKEEEPERYREAVAAGVIKPLPE